MTDNYRPGDVTLTPFNLTSVNGDRKADISAQIQHIDIYESIMSPVIYAEVLMLDGIDLHTKFPIIGEEYISFTFNTPGLPKARAIKLSVFEVANVTTDNSGLKKAYVLKCISPEMYESNKQYVYSKNNDQISSAIQKLLTQIAPSRKFAYEPTQGIDTSLIAKMKPFQAIDFLRHRAVSSKYKSSSFCFYENKDGYNLHTLEGMFDNGKGNIGDKIFFFDNNVNQDVRTVSYRTLLGYQHMKLSNSLHTVGAGGIKNNVFKFDLITGLVDKIENLDPKFDGADAKTRPMNTSAFLQKFAGEASSSHLVPFDSSLPDGMTSEKASYLQSFVQQLTQNLARIHIYGDASMTAGDVITCNLPSADGSTSKSVDNRLASGNYLVAKIRHMINTDATPTYKSSCELIKTGFITNA